MPRSADYYEQRLNNTSTPTVTQPQAQPQQQQPTQQNGPMVFPTGGTAELDAALETQKKKAFDNYITREAGRSVASRFPYEFANVLFDAPTNPDKRFNVGEFDFPDDMDWQFMSPWEKTKAMAAGTKQLAKRTIWALPKTLISAIPKAGLTIVQGVEEGIQTVTGNQDKKNIVPDKISLPLLGEINGFRGTYEERRGMGFSPFMASVSATGEFAGDIAITASLTEAVGAAFKPSAKVVTPKVKGTDPRPLKGVEVETGAKLKGTDLAKNGKLFEAVQNSETSYFKVPNSVASKYGGNANNTFLKVTPAGQGLAEFSVVQLRKSLVEQTKDALTSKFGRGNVVEGKMGPELKVDSAIVKYNPNVALARGEMAPLTRASSIDRMLSKDPRFANRAMNEANTAAVVQKTLAGEREAMRMTNEQALTRAKSGGFVPEDATPETLITVYRAGTEDIKVGDHITLDKSNAERYVKQREGAQLYETQVPISELVKSEGIRSEFIYAPSKAIGVQQTPFNGDEFKNPPPLQPQKDKLQEMQSQATDLTNTVVPRPVKGMEKTLVSGNEMQQIANLADARGVDDMTLQSISKAITGKQNIAELTKKEAFDVSETVRLFNQTDEFLYGDRDMLIRPFTHPARYWMEAAEREMGHPIYSQVYLPIENAMRLNKVFKTSWQNESRQVFGKYEKPKYLEERRAITRYLEGDKASLLKNEAFKDATKKELVQIADWLQEQYKVFFKEVGIESQRFLEVYSPQIRERGGIFNLYKANEVPNEIKPFYEFEREGNFVPMEDDALALFDIYSGMVGKKKFLHDPVETAKMQIEKLPENLRASTNDYLQEKMGYQDKLSQALNKFSQNLSAKLGNKIPENIARQIVDYGMTTSYAGALGLPRIMPIVRNMMQPFFTTYPELGPEWFAKGMKSFLSDKNAVKEIRDKGFLVDGGVPYGGDLISISKRSKFGQAMNGYKSFNETMLKPYASADVFNRGVTYMGAKGRFEHYWQQFTEGKINWNAMEDGIDIQSFNPTLRNIVRNKLQSNSTKSVEEARDLMIQDVIDRTQFPYRKGTQSRLHYGLKGKLGLQFAQWTWEYVFTLKSWAARGQWMKFVRWYAASAAIKRTWEDLAGVDVDKWVGTGPITGLPLGPLTNAGWSAIQMINGAAQGMADEVNSNWKEIVNTMKIYGGTLTGVGAQRWMKAKQSIDRYEAGISQSPDPEKPFGMYSSTGKLMRWVSFDELFKYTLGFPTTEEADFRGNLNRVKKDEVEYDNKVNKAMNMLVDGNMDKFNEYVDKHQLYMGDVSAKLKSYNIELDQRIFQNLPLPLKEKYFSVFFPTDTGVSAPKQ